MHVIELNTLQMTCIEFSQQHGEAIFNTIPLFLFIDEETEAGQTAASSLVWSWDLYPGVCDFWAVNHYARPFHSLYKGRDLSIAEELRENRLS